MLILHFSVLELGPGKSELVSNMTLKCQCNSLMTAYVLRFILTVLDCKLKIAVKQFQSRLWCKLCIADSTSYFARFKILKWMKLMLITNKFLIHSAFMNSGVLPLPQHFDPCDPLLEIPHFVLINNIGNSLLMLTGLHQILSLGMHWIYFWKPKFIFKS